MPPSEPPSVQRAFDAGAAAYDAARRRLVPCFDAFYAAALARLDVPRDAAIRVLDLGAGTGLLASLVAAAHPRAELVLVDVAEEMLARARTRFAGRPGVTLAAADFARADLPGPFDAIVSALAIHHLARDEKRGLFARVRDALAPGGVFVNADQILGPSAEDDRARHAAWRAAARRQGASEEELASAQERMRLDRCDTVADQLAWLREAGLADVTLAFEDSIFAVFSGRRPSAG